MAQQIPVSTDPDEVLPARRRSALEILNYSATRRLFYLEGRATDAGEDNFTNFLDFGDTKTYQPDQHGLVYSGPLTLWWSGADAEGSAMLTERRA